MKICLDFSSHTTGQDPILINGGKSKTHPGESGPAHFIIFPRREMVVGVAAEAERRKTDFFGKEEEEEERCPAQKKERG